MSEEIVANGGWGEGRRTGRPVTEKLRATVWVCVAGGVLVLMALAVASPPFTDPTLLAALTFFVLMIAVLGTAAALVGRRERLVEIVELVEDSDVDLRNHY